MCDSEEGPEGLRATGARKSRLCSRSILASYGEARRSDFGAKAAQGRFVTGVLIVNSASHASQQQTTDPASRATRLMRGDWQIGQYNTTNGESGSRPNRDDTTAIVVLEVFRFRTTYLAV